MSSNRMRAAALAVATLTLAACATVQTPSKDDPFEGFNRTVFQLNDKVDQYALKPAAQGYEKVVPKPVRDSVTNFFGNIGDVYNAANDFLQLKIADGVEDIMRILMNTLFGVGGLFDIATQARLPKHNQDFGLTLGHYGVPAGPYLVLPLFGPSTVRDATSWVANYFVDPFTYVDPDAIGWGTDALNVLNTRANLLGATDLLSGAALDKYSFLRNAYLQRRQYQLMQGGAFGAAGAAGGDGGSALPKYDLDDGAAPGAAAIATPASGAAAAPQAASAPAAASAPDGADNNYAPPGVRVPVPGALRLR